MPLLYQTVTGSTPAAIGLLFLSKFGARQYHWARLTPAVLGIWAFATIGSLTAASRCTWAFSRDGGIPASGIWRRVNHRYEVPLWSLVLSTIVCALLGLIYLGSSAAFNAFTGGELDPSRSGLC